MFSQASLAPPETLAYSFAASAGFTLDGDSRLERRLHSLGQKVLRSVQVLIPGGKLEALVLGGGYGRGEGGVLKTVDGDQPYNDLDFYVFIRGNRMLNERRYSGRLNTLGDSLSPGAGVHVEFKVDSLQRLRTAPVSMFSYDLLSGHKLLCGTPDAFRGCEHHLEAAAIPLDEATRLLLNRCSGLLLVKDLLRQGNLTLEDQDFCGRNLAKAGLALGDAILAGWGQYHWSCLERHRRLRALLLQAFSTPSGLPEWVSRIDAIHARGVKFKLHPTRASRSLEEFRAEHYELCRLAWQVWLWLERRRLGAPFATPLDYARLPLQLCRGTRSVRNLLLSIRSFGVGSLFDRRAFRYPRERLLRALPVLLWDEAVNGDLREVQEQLHVRSGDWTALVAAYRTIWPNYG